MNVGTAGKGLESGVGASQGTAPAGFVLGAVLSSPCFPLTKAIEHGLLEFNS